MADTRAADLRVTAKCSFTAAKTAWMELPQSDETWAQRCARVIPNTSQRTVDALISGKSEEMDGSAEDRLKAACEAEGLEYIPPEDREALAERFKEAAAKRRKEQAQASAAARWKPADADRNEVSDEHAPSNASEASQARRDEAEAIRVANGGKPSQQRMTSVHKGIFDKWMALGKSIEHAGELLAALDGAERALKKHRREGWTPA